MPCDNFFCIYQSEGVCILKEIQIDHVGVCASCIYPNIDEAYLKQEKLKLLQKYQEEAET